MAQFASQCIFYPIRLLVGRWYKGVVGPPVVKYFGQNAYDSGK